MPTRKKPGEEKKESGLIFQLPITLAFSIAATPSIAEEFKFLVNNNNENVSQVLRDFLLKRLNIKDLVEFNIRMDKSVKLAKQIIFEELKCDRRKNSISKMLNEDINSYIKRYKQ